MQKNNELSSSITFFGQLSSPSPPFNPRLELAFSKYHFKHSASIENCNEKALLAKLSKLPTSHTRDNLHLIFQAMINNLIECTELPHEEDAKKMTNILLNWADEHELPANSPEYMIVAKAALYAQKFGVAELLIQSEVTKIKFSSKQYIFSLFDKLNDCLVNKEKNDFSLFFLRQIRFLCGLICLNQHDISTIKSRIQKIQETIIKSMPPSNDLLIALATFKQLFAKCNTKDSSLKIVTTPTQHH